MIDNSFKQYMAQLKVNLLEAHKTTVSSHWGEKNVKTDYAKLYLIQSGKGFIKIDNVTYYPREGEVIYIPEGCLLSFGPIGKDYYSKYWCHFNAHIGPKAVNEIFDFPKIIHLNDVCSFELAFEDVLQAFTSTDDLSPILANCQLMKLLYHYFEACDLQNIQLKQQASSMKLNQLLIYMEQSIHRKLTIDDLVKVVNLHPSYLIKYFKSSFGMSPIAYFNRLKIEKAKELLTIRSEPIKSIAMSLGFTSAYYFSSTFKKQTGYTPSEFRKNGQ